MRLPVLVLSLVLLATGCSDDGAGDGDSATDVCDRLSLEVASGIVGVDYTMNGQSRGLCIYQRPGTDQAFGLRVIAYEDDFDTVVADAEEIGYRSRAVNVPGADRAVALSGSLRSVVAEQGGDAFEVTFNGDVATARQLMTAVLDGVGDAIYFAPGRVADPCDSLSPTEVRRLLGVPAKAQRDTREVALKSCTWRSDGRELVVAAAWGRGPVEEFWDENFFVGKGVEPERVGVAGADGALLVSSKRDETVGLAVARGDLSYVVTVGGGVADARAVAAQVAALLLGGG